MLGPNDHCRCGSGQKYKKCHLELDRAARPKAGGPSEAQKRKWKDEAVVELAAGRPSDFNLEPLTAYPRELLLTATSDTAETAQLKR